MDLAALFHNAWEPREELGEKPRYRLVRSTRSRKYEDGLAQSARRRVLARLEAQVRALSETPEQLARRAQNDPIRTNLSNPKARLGTLLYGALSPSQQEALITDHACFVRFSSLNPPQQSAVRDMFAGFIAENHAEIQRMQERFPGAIIHNHRLEQEDLDSDSIRFFIDGGKSSLTIAFSLTGDLMTAGVFATVGKPERYQLPLRGNPYTGKAVAANASLADLKAVALAIREKEWIDSLRVLAEASGTPVMADLFRAKDEDALHDNPASVGGSGGTSIAVNALDTLCGPRGYLWWTSGKTLLLRTRTWYETRRYEIPDRWWLDVSKRLQAQRGIPTYNDVLRLLELTPEQLYGLQSALHYSASGAGREYTAAQQKELLAARNLLELLRDNASPLGNSGPVPTWNDLVSRKLNGTLAQVILSYDTLTPRQRGLIPAYLQTHPHKFTPQQGTDFIGLVFRPEEAVAVGADGYRNVTVHVIGGFGTGVLEARDPLNAVQMTGSNPVFLTLPLSMPDDRRKNTRIEVIVSRSPHYNP
jgi:hypothetical protein